MLGEVIESYGTHKYGPRAVNSLGETICLNCGRHFDAVTGTDVTCSGRCRSALQDRGGRMGWREFRLRVAELT